MKFKSTKKNKDKAKKSALVLSRWEIIKRTIRRYKQDIRWYLPAAGVILIPSAVVRNYSTAQKDSSGSDLSVVLFLVSLVCVLVLYWITERRGNAKKVRDHYVQSMASFLPFLAVTIVLGLLLIPFGLGVFMSLLTISFAQSAIFIIGGVLFIILSLYFLIRLSLAFVVVVDPARNWRQSLAAAWRVSRRRWWYLFWSYLLYFIMIGILSGVILTLFGLIPGVGRNEVFIGFINGILLTFTLPILVIYTTLIYRNLGGIADAQS